MSLDNRISNKYIENVYNLEYYFYLKDTIKCAPLQSDQSQFNSIMEFLHFPIINYYIFLIQH